MTENRNPTLEDQAADNADQEPATSTRPQGALQDFNQIRQECLTVGKLFEDPEFPAQDSSMFYSKKLDNAIEWKRPTEITSDPRLFIDGFSRFDLNQGDLSDCWFIAALANLAMHPKLFLQVVPEDQSFEVNYAGIFHFRFWQYGKWVDVVVDDRLPTNEGKLMYLGSPDNKEFWGALIEKAYAKLHGSYEALVDGMGYEAMEDFTGGISEMYDMNAIPANLFSLLLEAQKRNSLMGCITEQVLNMTESKTPQGLITWHSYSITDVKYVARQKSNSTERVLLLRLRNPWGNHDEWNREWSDESPEWRSISDSERDQLNLKFDSDGEFWMTFQDFKRYFTSVDICNLSPDSLADSNPVKRKWELSAVEGKWVRGVSAGGCNNFPDTFWQNPQYRITLEHQDKDDDKCTMIISLSQKNRRAQKWKGIDKLHIGFSVYHLRNPNTLPKPLDQNYFAENKDDYVGGTPMFLTNRGANRRLKLPPGVYCIIPSTFEPDDEGEFLLRVFSDSKNTNMKEYNKQVGISGVVQRNNGVEEDLNNQNHGDEGNVEISQNGDEDLDPENDDVVENHDAEGNLDANIPNVQENVNTKNDGAEEDMDTVNHGVDEDSDSNIHGVEENVDTKNDSAEEDMDTVNHGVDEDSDSNTHGVEENVDTKNDNAEEDIDTMNHGVDEDSDSNIHGVEENVNTENDDAEEDVHFVNHGAEQELSTKTHGVEGNVDTMNYDAQEDVNNMNYDVKEDVDPKNNGVEEDLDTKNHYVEGDLNRKNYGTKQDVEIKNEVVEDDVDNENHDRMQRLDTKNNVSEEDIDKTKLDARENLNTVLNDVEENSDAKDYSVEEDVDTKSYGSEENLNIKNYVAEEDMSTANHRVEEDINNKSCHIEGNSNAKNCGVQKNLDFKIYGTKKDVDTKKHGTEENIATKDSGMENNTDAKKYNAAKNLHTKNYGAEN